jgi:hypothetical protein
MAGDWIKYRASLGTHPKVWKMADLLGSSLDVGRRLLTDHNGALDEKVTRDVTRDVTLAALLRVWCATNEHTEDGIWHMSTLDTLDNAAGIVGFGAAMAAVEWAIYDAGNQTVTLPNFTEYNAPAKHSARSTGAKRQAKYREKIKAERYASPSVTGDVTSNDREEKRRDKNKELTDAKPSPAPSPKTKRKTGIPDPFPITAEMIVWANDRAPAADLTLETEKFLNYWKAKGETRADWLASWRNWILNAQSYAGRRIVPTANKGLDFDDLTWTQNLGSL